MKLSKLIWCLRQTMYYNGDMDVVGMVDGKVFNEIEINCPAEKSAMYIELYHSDSDRHEKHILNDEKHHSYRCPRCNNTVYPSDRHCIKCYQQLDWD